MCSFLSFFVSIHVFSYDRLIQGKLVFDEEKKEIVSPRMKILWEIQEGTEKTGGKPIVNLHPQDGFLFDEVEEADDT